MGQFSESTIVILSFTMLVAGVHMANAGLPGGYTSVTEEEAKKDVDLQRGISTIHKKLVEGRNTAPGLIVDVATPGMQSYKQTVAGILYHYKWNKEEYTTKCDPKSNALCKQPEKKESKDVECTAEYWVKPWEKFEKLTEFKCE